MSHDPFSKIARFCTTRCIYRDAADKDPQSGHLARVARRLKITQGGKGLDVACRTGDWLVTAASRGAAIRWKACAKQMVASFARRSAGHY